MAHKEPTKQDIITAIDKAVDNLNTSQWGMLPPRKRHAKVNSAMIGLMRLRDKLRPYILDKPNDCL